MSERGRRTTCPVVAGRDLELEQIRSRVLAPADSGSVVTILGEAGCGKSRVSQESVAAARERGTTVLAGACMEGQLSAYAPVVDALRRHLRNATKTQAARLFSGAARFAAVLVPEVADASRVAAPARPIAAEHLFASLSHVFHRLALERPVLLLIEDLHWADADTLDMLMYLAREAPELRLCVVLNARSDGLAAEHPLLRVLSALRRLPWAIEVVLRPLDRNAVELMMRALLDAPVSAALVDAMTERSGGVPYFIEEICSSLDVVSMPDPALTDPSTAALRVVLPPSLRDAMLSRLARLDAGTLWLLQLAAVAGDRVDRRLLADAAQTEIARIDEAIDAALRQGVLVEAVEERAVRQGFRHALMREALVSELGSVDARDAHRRVADSLARKQAGTNADAAAVSRHYEAAGEPAEALHFSLEAARYADQRVAPAETLAHLTAALRLAAQTGADELPILMDAAAAGIRSGGAHAADVESLAQRARALARERGAVVQEANALNLISACRWNAGDTDAAIVLSAGACDLVRGRDDSAEADSLARRMVWLAAARRDESVPSLLARGRAVASASGNLRALSDMERAAGLCAADSAAAEEAFAASMRAARAANDVEREIDALSDASVTALLGGRIRRARDGAERALAAVDPGVEALPQVSMLLAYATALAGDLDGALRRVAAVSVERLLAGPRAYAYGALVESYLRRGEATPALAAADAVHRLAAEDGSGPALAQQLYVRVHAALGDESAAHILEPLLNGHLQPHWLVSPDVVRFLARRGEGKRLHNFVKRVDEWTDVGATPASRGPGGRAARDFCDGVLAAYRHDWVSASARLEASVTAFAELPIPARQVEALIELAHARVGEGQRRSAVRLLLEGRAIADQITASGLELEVAAAMRELGARTPANAYRVAQLGGLSAKEAEIAVLIGAGRSNREIAELLVVSPRTVANHVSNILAKLELHNRGDVARWTMSRGIMQLEAGGRVISRDVLRPR